MSKIGTIQRPYAIKVNGSNIANETIDANISNSLSWSVSGDVSTQFRIVITKNSDGSSVFDTGKITSYAISYDLAANSGSMVNGEQYKIVITVFNSLGQNASSYAQIFNTSQTPTVTLSTIGSPVGSSSYTFSATYSQVQNESMVSWIAYLYDSNKNLIGSSNIQTSSTISYMFVGLETGNLYYIEIQASGANDLTGTTGLVEFNVEYGQPTVGMELTATNNVDSGTISLSWNIVQIIGNTDDSNLTYINNEIVDLTDGKNVWFDANFNILNNFSCKLWVNSPVPNKDIVTFYGDNGNITLQYGDDNRFHLNKTITGTSKLTHVYSDIVDTTYFSGSQPMKVITNTYFLFIQQVDFDINITAQHL